MFGLSKSFVGVLVVVAGAQFAQGGMLLLLHYFYVILIFS